MKPKSRTIFNLEKAGFLFTLIAFALLLSSHQSAGQEFRGSISGMVSDATGAALPGAKVTVTNVATNVPATTTTGAGGNYTVLYLPPGQYTISAEAKGFKKLVRSGIEVQIGDRLTVNLPLEVGSVTEEVRVTAEAPLLETSEASQGQVVDQRNIEDLPLPDGDPFVLARTAGGLAFTGNLLFARPFDNGGVSSIRASGAPGGNEFTLDGSPDMGSGLRVAFVPPSDAVQEFKVITSNFDAQQGHTAGADVNVVSKSGTNSVHGTLYEFDRNDALSANDFFSNRLHMRKQKLRYHRWGGTVGGPVFIPKIYNGKNKTFFFFAYEGLIDNQPETNTFTVPTLAERNGDLSALLAPKAGNIKIYDPYTASPSSGGHVTRQALVCNGQANVICPNRLSPIAQAYLNLYPLPNIPGNEQGQNNYFSGNPRTDHFDSETLRIDHELTSKQKAFLRLYRNWRQELRGNWSGLVGGVRATGNNLFRINDGIDYDEVYTISPTTLLDARLGFARFTEYNRRPSEFSKFDPATLGWSPQVLAFFRGAKYLPRFNIDKFSALGDTVGDTTSFNVYSFQPTLTKLFHGGHSLRFGYDFRVYRENNINPASQAGTYTFNSDYTRQTDSSSGQIGQGLAALLLGQPTGGNLDNNTSRANQTIYQGLFVQDDWKATRKLTLNIGLRYEYEGATTERFDRNVRGFDAVDPNPVAAAVMANYAQIYAAAKAGTFPIAPSDFHVNGGLLYPNSSHRAFWRPDRTNFQPRLGFAYALTERTVVRGGWGIFSSPFIINGVNAGGFSRATDVTPTLDKGLTFRSNLANPFPDGLAPVPGSSAGLATFIGGGLGTIVPLKRRNSRAQQWIFNVQRQINKDWMVQASYVGARGYDLDAGVDLNPIPAQYLSRSPIRDDLVINTLSASVTNPFNCCPYNAQLGLAPWTGNNGPTISLSQLLRPFPEFTTVDSRTNKGRSSYNSLMISTNKRMSHGFTASGSYTFSKFLEQTSKLNATDTHYTKRLSGDDIPHRFTTSFIWELPFGPRRHWGSDWHGATDKFLGGWQMGGIYYWQSGRPLTFGNWVYFGDPRQLRTNISGSTVDHAFPIAGFYFTDAAVQTNGVVDPAKQRSDKRIQLSNNIRTLPFTQSGFRGQPLNYWEGINVIKKTSIGERVNTELRFSFQNAFNHPEFNNPNTDPTSSNFGKVTDQVGFSLPRNIEVGLKIKF